MAERKQNYFSSLTARQNFPVATNEKGFENTSKLLAGVQATRSALSSLGEKEKKKNRGILSTLFDEQKGIYTMPLRFSSALILDALGFENKAFGEELKGKNPLESAIASAKGDFAITGGDIIKVNDDDSFLERLGKYAGALAFDIAADPLSYVGPVGILSKKSGAIVAVREGDNILAKATEALVEKGGKAETLVDDLFRRSRIFNAADIQRRYSKLDSVIDPDSPLGLLGLKAGDVLDDAALSNVEKALKTGAVDNTIKTKLAGSELGLITGEAFFTGGRAKVKRVLKELLGSDEAASKVFQSLPDDIRGGLFLKTPFSGRPVARIAGGKGAGGKAAEYISGRRFAVASSVGTGWISKYISGQAGPTWLAVKKDMLKGGELSDIARTTILDYVTYKDALREKNIFLKRSRELSGAQLSSIIATGKMLEKQGEGETFEKAFKTYFMSPNLSLADDASEAVKEGYNAAQFAHKEILQAHRENMAAIRADMGDLGYGQVPLLLSDEGEDIVKNRLRKAGQSESVDYNPARRRVFGIQYITDPEERAILGLDAPGIKNAVIVNPVSANELLVRAGKKPRFEEDPIKILQTYLDFSISTQAARRFNQVALNSGTFIKLPAETEKLLKEYEFVSFLSAAPKATSAVRQKLDIANKRLREQLDSLTSDAKLKSVQQDMANVQAAALTDYRNGQQAVRNAQSALTMSNAEVAVAARQYEKFFVEGKNFQQFAETGVAQQESKFYRQMRNSQARLSKARRAVTDIEDELSSLNNVFQGFELSNEFRDRLNKLEREFISVDDARNLLDEARQYKATTISRMSQKQVEVINTYEQALAKQVKAAEDLAAAKSLRDRGRDAWYLSRKNTTLQKATAVNVVVDAYVAAREKFLAMQNQFGKRVNKNMTEEQINTFNTTKKAFEEAKKGMMQVLGRVSNVKNINAGTEYAKAVIKAADKLSQDNFIAARIIADADKMDQLVRSLENTTRETKLNFVGDIFTTYRSIREVLTYDDLKELGRLERRALALDAKDVVTSEEVTSRAAEELGDVTKGNVRQIAVGEKGSGVILPHNLQEIYAPEGVASLLEQIYRAQAEPENWKKYVDTIIDPLALAWRSSATVARGPAYLLNNVVGGIANNYYARVSMKFHRYSAAMIYETTSMVKKLQKKYPEESFDMLTQRLAKEFEYKLSKTMVGDKSIPELFTDYLDRGGAMTTHTETLRDDFANLGMRTDPGFDGKSGVKRIPAQPNETGAQAASRIIANLVMTNPYQVAMSNFAQNSEIFLRFAAFLEGYKRFKNVDSAMDFSTALHFDYQDLSGAEVWIKRVIAPFYTWARHNIPLQFRAIFLAPDQMGKLIKMNNNLREAFGLDEEDQWLNDYMPDFLNNSMGFISKKSFGGNHIGLFSKLPLTDLDKMFKVEYIQGIPYIWLRGNEVVNMVGPNLKAPIEVFTGRNFQYGNKFESSSDMIEELGSTLVPQFNIGRNIASAAGIYKPEKQESSLWNLLLGSPVGATTITEKTLNAAAINKNRDLSKQLKQAADKAGVDVDWLRDQVKKGFKPEQIMRRIMMGYGNKDRIALMRSITEEPKQTRDYLAVLTGLSEGRIVTGY